MLGMYDGVNASGVSLSEELKQMWLYCRTSPQEKRPYGIPKFQLPIHCEHEPR